MKERDHRPGIVRDVAWGYRSRFYICLLFCCLVSCVTLHAQKMPLTHGERVDYDLYFKWGLLMPKAGLATLSVKEIQYKGNPAWSYRLLFRSMGMLDKLFSMRDTMDCVFSGEHRLLLSSKRTDEGDYYLIDNLMFSYKDNGKVSIRSHRYHWEETKIDTLLTAEGYVFDMLGATMYLRSLDWTAMSADDEFPFLIAIGRDIVKSRFRYSGQQIVEHGGVKYRTRHFFIDIYDEAFTQTKAAAEVWIGDDENHIPIKIRAKLKIGAAEVYYKESFNLRHSLSCRIAVPKR